MPFHHIAIYITCVLSSVLVAKLCKFPVMKLSDSISGKWFTNHVIKITSILENIWTTELDQL